MVNCSVVTSLKSQDLKSKKINKTSHNISLWHEWLVGKQSIITSYSNEEHQAKALTSVCPSLCPWMSELLKYACLAVLSWQISGILFRGWLLVCSKQKQVTLVQLIISSKSLYPSYSRCSIYTTWATSQSQRSIRSDHMRVGSWPGYEWAHTRAPWGHGCHSGLVHCGQVTSPTRQGETVTVTLAEKLQIPNSAWALLN